MILHPFWLSSRDGAECSAKQHAGASNKAKPMGTCYADERERGACSHQVQVLGGQGDPVARVVVLISSVPIRIRVLLPCHCRNTVRGLATQCSGRAKQRQPTSETFEHDMMNQGVDQVQHTTPNPIVSVRMASNNDPETKRQSEMEKQASH